MTDDDPTYRIPTGYRAKHSHLRSYPVGAEVLTRELARVPQLRALTAEFTSGSDTSSDRVVVLTVLYRKRPRSFYDGADASARGVLDARWSVTVHAVPKALRHVIRESLLHDALSTTVAGWLQQQAHQDGRTGELFLRLVFDVTARQLLATRGEALLADRA